LKNDKLDKGLFLSKY